MFKLDPAMVLEEPDQFKVAARLAAALYVQEEKKRAADEIGKKK
ncbi:hypothetical protein [Brevibacterium moorei]|nr:hypothetical protein [Brevibacterium sp. 68QC2CO]MCQ9384452.1 hypothetical protein [Brevibacterium sp. 68QC2CO]